MRYDQYPRQRGARRVANGAADRAPLGEGHLEISVAPRIDFRKRWCKPRAGRKDPEEIGGVGHPDEPEAPIRAGPCLLGLGAVPDSPGDQRVGDRPAVGRRHDPGHIAVVPLRADRPV